MTTPRLFRCASAKVLTSNLTRLTGDGDPYGELSSQIAKAMANKVDNDVLATLKGATQNVSVTATVDGIQDALDIYNDEDDSRIVLLVSPKAHHRL